LPQKLNVNKRRRTMTKRTTKAFQITGSPRQVEQCMAILRCLGESTANIAGTDEARVEISEIDYVEYVVGMLNNHHLQREAVTH
jgi:hypothetical protein